MQTTKTGSKKNRPSGKTYNKWSDWVSNPKTTHKENPGPDGAMLNPNTSSLQTLLKSSQQNNVSQLRLRGENVPECKAWKKHIKSKESSMALFLMNMDEKRPQNLVTNEMQQYMKKKIMTKWDFFFPRKGNFYNSPGLINTTPVCDVWWGVYTSFLTQPRLSEKVNSTGNGLEQVSLWHMCREQPFPRLNGVRVMGTSRA